MLLAYVFHKCGTSLLRRDFHVADCTVKDSGVERPFSSFYLDGVELY